jgi:hypothetical protein
MYSITPSEMTCSGLARDGASRITKISSAPLALPRIPRLPSYTPLAAAQQYSPLTPRPHLPHTAITRLGLAMPYTPIPLAMHPESPLFLSSSVQGQGHIPPTVKIAPGIIYTRYISGSKTPPFFFVRYAATRSAVRLCVSASLFIASACCLPRPNPPSHLAPTATAPSQHATIPLSHTRSDADIPRAQSPNQGGNQRPDPRYHADTLQIQLIRWSGEHLREDRRFNDEEGEEVAVCDNAPGYWLYSSAALPRGLASEKRWA